MLIGICDDNPLTLKKIGEYIDTINKKKTYTLEARYYKSGEELLLEYTNQYKLLLLDIEMKELNGIETARKIREKDKEVKIIFITNFLQYATEGYKVNAYRYLLKPISYQVFVKEIDSVLEEIDKSCKEIFIKSKNKSYKMKLNDLIFIESYGHYIIYHMKEEKISVRSSLKLLNKELSDYYFFQVHKSYIINLSYVSSYNYQSVTMETGESIPISKYRYQEFKKKYVAFWGNRIS